MAAERGVAFDRIHNTDALSGDVKVSRVCFTPFLLLKQSLRQPAADQMGVKHPQLQTGKTTSALNPATNA